MSAAIKDRVQFIDHKGKKILLIDFSNCAPQECIEIIDLAKPIFAKQPASSVLALDYVSNARYDMKTVDALKAFTAHNKPYVKAVAIVGISGLQKILLQSVQAFTKRSFSLFDDINQAKDWLISQN